jgi:hypothetical protein
MIDEDYSLYARGMDLFQLYSRCAVQYLHWNARIGDVLSLILSELPVKAFNILNAFSVFGFILLLQRFAKILAHPLLYKVRTYRDASIFIVIFLLLLFYVLQPNQIFFWRAGSANYFYPVLFVPVYCLPFILLLVKDRNVFENIPKPYLRYMAYIGYITIGIVIGHANENTSPVLVIAIAALIAFRYIKYRKVDAWVLACLVTVGIGTALLLFGPSTQYRLAFYSAHNGQVNSYYGNLRRNLLPCLKIFLQLGLPIFGILLILSIAIHRDRRRKALWATTVLCFVLSFWLPAAVNG